MRALTFLIFAIVAMGACWAVLRAGDRHADDINRRGVDDV